MTSHSPFASLQSFRRDHGEPAAPRPCVFAAPISPGPGRTPGGTLGGSGGRWLVATVEPVDKTAFGWDVAEQALEALRQGFATQYDSNIPDALARGFAAANACVRAANRGERGRKRGERVFVGAAAMALDGQSLVFAHVPPSQIVFTQDQLVYTIPALHSWEPHYAGLDRSKAKPLGARDQIQPDLFRTSVIERDTIVLCSTSLGRAISTLPALQDRLRPPTDPTGRPLASLPVGPAEHPITTLDMGSVRPAGPDPAEAWVDWLDHLASDRNVPTCHAVAATMGQVESRASSGAGGRSRPRERTGRQIAEPEPAPHPPLPTFRQSDDAFDRTGKPCLMHRPVPPVPAPRHTRLPGANGLLRFHDSEGVRPGSWRVRIPRIDFRHRVEPPRWLALTLALLVLLAAGTGIAYLRSASVEHHLSDALARIDGQLVFAESSDDASGLGIVRGQLRTLVTRFGASSDLDQCWVRLTIVEDRLLGRLRLAAPTEVGLMPAESIPTDRLPRLLHAGTDVFLVGNSLYQLDTESNQLTYLIGAGDAVDGLITGPIVDAVATRSGIAVTDGVTLFDRDGRGNWSAEPFDARLNLPAGQVSAIALYDDQIVAIDGANGGLVALPLAGTATGGVPALPSSMLGSLAGALDLAVDDDPFVLGGAGDLVSFDRGGRIVPMSVPVTPPLTLPRAMDASGSNLWIFDTGVGTGRLVCYSPSEDTAIVYELPVVGIDAAGPLSTASDFAIDATNSRIVFIVDDTLWSVPLPVAG